jgi:hypothetical protein
MSPYVCRDRELGNCSGRAYKRKGVAWILCRQHWHELLGILAWAARGRAGEAHTQ